MSKSERKNKEGLKWKDIALNGEFTQRGKFTPGKWLYIKLY